MSFGTNSSRPSRGACGPADGAGWMELRSGSASPQDREAGEPWPGSEGRGAGKHKADGLISHEEVARAELGQDGRCDGPGAAPLWQRRGGKQRVTRDGEAGW